MAPSRLGAAMNNEMTSILSAVEQGDPQAAEQLLPLVYDELHKLAVQKLAQEKPGQTLQATALVHEAYLRLVGSQDPGWNGRGHFFSAAAEAMRRILVENAPEETAPSRRRQPKTRPGGAGSGRRCAGRGLAGTRRSLGAARTERPRCGATGQAPVLRRADHGGCRSRTRDTAENRRAQLDLRADVAASGDLLRPGVEARLT